MKFIHTSVLVIILLPTAIFSQEVNFNVLMNQLATEVQQVESKKYTYEQAITFDKAFPYRVAFEASRIDSKGKTKTQTYHFNLKDFDTNSLRKDNVKDVIVAQMNVNRKQKFVSIMVDGKRGNYTNEIEFIATDVDNARRIIDLLKRIIPLAKDIPPAAPLPASFDARMTWLEKNIGKAEKDGKPIIQKIKKDVAFRTRLVFDSEQEGKKSIKKKTYSFNLIDLQGKKIKLDIKGKNLFIKINASEKFIQYEERNKIGNYQDDFKIYVPNVEKGKEILTVFQALIEESPNEVRTLAAKGGMSVVPTYDGKNTFVQKMEGQCLVTFESSFENKKGATITEKSILNLDDMNAKSVEIKVSKKTIWINSKTNNSKKFIQNFKNGDTQNFSKKLGIRASNVENARVLQKELVAAIENCEGKSACEIPNEGTDGLMNFAKDQISNITIGSKSFQQKLELTNEQPNQWKFTRIESKKKEDEEKSFVFNLSDIDGKRIDFSISKKVVVITLPTKKSEEIIKTYKNSEPDDYEKKFEMYVSDIVTARKIVCALQAAMEKL